MEVYCMQCPLLALAIESNITAVILGCAILRGSVSLCNCTCSDIQTRSCNKRDKSTIVITKDSYRVHICEDKELTKGGSAIEGHYTLVCIMRFYATHLRLRAHHILNCNSTPKVWQTVSR